MASAQKPERPRAPHHVLGLPKRTRAVTVGDTGNLHHRVLAPGPHRARLEERAGIGASTHREEKKCAARFWPCRRGRETKA